RRRRHPPPPLPYTTLFRSYEADHLFGALASDADRATLVNAQGTTLALSGGATYTLREGEVLRDGARVATGVKDVAFERPDPSHRSEEHTSELQSRVDLVCR